MSARVLPAPSASGGPERDRYSPETAGGREASASAVRPHGRVYLGRRDVRSPETARRAAFEAISAWESTVVKNAMGQRFRASVRVGLRRPWWMPAPLYHRLLSSIVTESGWEQKR